MPDRNLSVAGRLKVLFAIPKNNSLQISKILPALSAFAQTAKWIMMEDNCLWPLMKNGDNKRPSESKGYWFIVIVKQNRS